MGQDTDHQPELRAAVHLAGLLFAFPLTKLVEKQWLAPGAAWAAGFCLLLFLFNLFVLPRLSLGRRIIRPGESGLSGPLIYPLALAVAFLVYPAYAVGAGWAAMAAGDAVAQVVGRQMSRPQLPWNKDKSWAGTLGFFAAAVPACALLLWWCPAPLFLARDELGNVTAPEWPYVWTLSVLAGVCGAILESLPGPFNDNFRVPLGVGLVVWLAALFLNFGTSGMAQDRAFQPQWLLHALAVNVGLAFLVWAFKWADLAAAIAGGIIGAAAYFFALPQGYLLLVLFVAGGSLLSRLGRETKEARGAAEARACRRSIGNVLGNLTVPALCCLAYPAAQGHPAALWAYAGALSAALADTASAEVGSLSKRLPRLITTRQEAPHGTDGAVTLLGYAAGGTACLLLVAAAWGAGFWRIAQHGHEWNAAPATVGYGLLVSGVVFAAGLVGTTVDSLLGATLEGRKGGLSKHTVNFFCTLSGALTAGLAGMILA